MKRIATLWLAASLAGAAFAHGDEDHGADAKKGTARAPAAATAAPPAVSSEAPQRQADGSLFVPKPLQRSLGILTQLAQAGEFPRVVEMPARVVADPAYAGRVQATQPGTVAAGSRGMVLMGAKVRKGEVLATLVPTIEAAARADRQSTLAQLAAQASVLEKRLERLAQLEGSVPRKEVEQARIELDSLHARRAALAGGLNGRLALTAPVDGVVAASFVTAGQVVDARETLFEIVDPRRLAVEARAFDAALAQRIGRATASTGEGGVRLDLDFVGAGRTLREQALPVLFRIRSTREGAPPPVAVGQPLKVLAEAGGTLRGVAVPAAAAARSGGNDTVVWLHESAERFVPRRVKALPLDAERLLVTEGLKGGERVVVQGVQSLTQVR